MPGQATDTAGVYLFEPNEKTCNLSILDKYPELCKRIGFNEEESLDKTNV